MSKSGSIIIKRSSGYKEMTYDDLNKDNELFAYKLGYPSKRIDKIVVYTIKDSLEDHLFRFVKQITANCHK